MIDVMLGSGWQDFTGRSPGGGGGEAQQGTTSKRCGSYCTPKAGYILKERDKLSGEQVPGMYAGEGCNIEILMMFVPPKQHVLLNSWDEQKLITTAAVAAGMKAKKNVEEMRLKL